MQAKLRATSSKCTELAQENSLLRERTSPAAASPPVEDALAEQAGPRGPMPCAAVHCSGVGGQLLCAALAVAVPSRWGMGCRPFCR